MSEVRRIVFFAMGTLTVLVLLFGYHTSTSSKAVASGEYSATAPSPAGAATPGITSGTAPGTASSTASSTGSAASTSGTVTGEAADTRWGPVQVELTVADGKITGVTVLQQPDGNGRDQQINDYALPILVQETISAQSARIDMVSGATVTSQGYLTSLQSALDQAGL